jgi:cbb3-type cytochrome oxidase subunit 3
MAGILLRSRPYATPVRAAVGADPDQVEGFHALAEFRGEAMLEQHERPPVPAGERVPDMPYRLSDLRRGAGLGERGQVAGLRTRSQPDTQMSNALPGQADRVPPERLVGDHLPERRQVIRRGRRQAFHYSVLPGVAHDVRCQPGQLLPPYHAPMSLELSGEITAIATSVLAVFAIVTAAFAILAFRKQSKEVRDQAAMLNVQSEQLDLQRQANLLQARSLVCGRVWTILTKEPGLRTVIALDEHRGAASEPVKRHRLRGRGARNRGGTGERVKLLRRTAYELDVAGAKTLGDMLRNVLRPDGEGRTTATAFVDAAIEFMNVPPNATPATPGDAPKLGHRPTRPGAWPAWLRCSV